MTPVQENVDVHLAGIYSGKEVEDSSFRRNDGDGVAVLGKHLLKLLGGGVVHIDLHGLCLPEVHKLGDDATQLIVEILGRAVLPLLPSLGDKGIPSVLKLLLHSLGHLEVNPMQRIVFMHELIHRLQDQRGHRRLSFRGFGYDNAVDVGRFPPVSLVSVV